MLRKRASSIWTAWLPQRVSGHKQPDLIPGSLILPHDDRLERHTCIRLVETVVLALDKGDIVWKIFLPLYQFEVDRSMCFTVWRLAHWSPVLRPLVGKEEAGALCHQQVLGETRGSMRD